MYSEKLEKADFLSMYRWLYLIKRTEESMIEINSHKPINELPHSSLGQEAISVGLCYGLKKEDQLLPSLRTRGAFIMKGISSRTMMGGAFGRDILPNHGKNTSHHIGDPSCGVVTTTGILAGHLPVAVGVGLALKMDKKNNVAVVVLGDGSCNRGDTHEAMNFAAIYDLPVVFIIENNQWAMSTPITKTAKVKHLSERAAAYGMPGITVDGNDVLAIYEACMAAYDRAREGKGPSVIECWTWRTRGHSEKDTRDPRPKELRDEWLKNNAVERFRSMVIDKGIATEDELKEQEKSAEAEVQDAVDFAENGPYPQADILETNVYEEA